MGNRIGKVIGSSSSNPVYQDYVRDASGNVMATYSRSYKVISQHTDAQSTISSGYEGNDFSLFNNTDYSALWNPAPPTGPFSSPHSVFLSNSSAYSNGPYGPVLKIQALAGDHVQASIKNYTESGAASALLVVALTDENGNPVSAANSGLNTEWVAAANTTTYSWETISINYTVPNGLTAREVYISIYPWVPNNAAGNSSAWFDDLLVQFTPGMRVNMRENRLLNEQHLYGSQMLGLVNNNTLTGQAFYTTAGGNRPTNGVIDGTQTAMQADAGNLLATRGQTQYQLGNHLGNVQSTLSDRKMDHTTWQITDVISSAGAACANTEQHYGSADGVSCKVYNLQPFGASYTYQVEAGDEIHIAGKSFVPDAAATAVLVVHVQTANGTNIYYNNPLFKDIANTGSQWQDFAYHYNVPAATPAGAKVVVYAYNTNANPIWVDDVNIVLTKAGAGNSSSAQQYADYYLPDVLSTSDYYCFGSPLPGRSYSSENYRYGFNGKEMDNEIKAITGSSYDFGDRMYDPRLGRWLTVDMSAKSAPGITPYRFGFDNPILYKDPNGQWEEDGHFWTVYALGIAMGLKKEDAFHIAFMAEYPDHIVHKDYSMEMHGHKDWLPSTFGVGTWGDEELQGDLHGLTGGLQSQVNSRAKNLILTGNLVYFHLLGDSWAHSYLNKEGIRVMYGRHGENEPLYAPIARLLLGNITFEHALGGPDHGKIADDIRNRPKEYGFYVDDLIKVFNNKDFMYHSLVKNFSPDKRLFNYVQSNGGTTDINVFIFKSFVEYKSGSKEYNNLSARQYMAWTGYLNKMGIKYTSTSNSNMKVTGLGKNDNVEFKTYNVKVIGN